MESKDSQVPSTTHEENIQDEPATTATGCCCCIMLIANLFTGFLNT